MPRHRGSPPWHRKKRAFRSKARHNHKTGRQLTHLQRQALLLHHATSAEFRRVLLSRHMGRGHKNQPQPWKSEDAYSWQLWQGARSPQLRGGTSWRPWRDTTSSAQSEFRTYTAMVPARDNAGPSAPGQAAIPTPSSGLVHDLQELLNAARKTENRLSKLQNGRAKVAEKWQLYQQKLKDAWMKEHGRFLRDTERLDRDIQEAAQEQGRAFQAVRQAWTQASQGPSVPMETSAEGQWEQLRNGWEQEDGAQLQAILQRATGVPLPGPSMDQQRQLKPELVQLLAHFGAGAVANGFGGPPPGLSSTSSDVPMSVGPMVPPGFGGDLAAPSATAPTDPAMAFNPGASTSKLVGDASTSPHHPGQRDLGAGRTPTTEAPPRKDVKSATRTQPTVDTLQGPGLAEKLDKKREHASGAALRPFGLPGPTDHPPPPVPVHNLSSTTSQDKESDDELDSASPPGHPSPGLGRMN